MKTLAEAQKQKITKPLLERDIQAACVDWARKRGYWARKFSSMTQRSVPDYLFAALGAHLMTQNNYSGKRLKFACEFKAPCKTSTSAQIDEQQAMRLAGWFVFECDDVDKFKRTVLAYENETV